MSGGLNMWESLQPLVQGVGIVLKAVAGILHGTAGGLHLIPEGGAPTAMKYGGAQVASSLSSFGSAASTFGGIADTLASMMGTQASYQRRYEGWEHQREVARKDVAQVERDVEVAALRLDVAQEQLSQHERSLEQQNEVFEFFEQKFTSIGLYTWMSTELQRLYREAYNHAYGMARLAEQAYHFERQTDLDTRIGSTHWTSSRAGLLAGERLLAELNAMEKRYLETDYRTLEVDQAFSLTQLDPASLYTLRETGTCTFSINEMALDLVYPGHYRRRIKSVRLTIPCVTGPYSNVNASLRLTGSRIRMEPTIDAADLLELPLSHTVAIATSSAQQDAGVFGLSFSDERYVPFEGAGAVSDWELNLPKNFRLFDYQTINDVLVHISYTALEDVAHRAVIDSLSASVAGSLQSLLSDSNMSVPRGFSLRQDFSETFIRLVHGDVGTEVQLQLAPIHFPLVFSGKILTLNRAVIIARTEDGGGLGSFSLEINGSDYDQFQVDAEFGALPAVDIGSAFSNDVFRPLHIKVKAAGDLVNRAGGAAAGSTLPNLADLLLYVEYRLG
jgi:hypothetical protein